MYVKVVNHQTYQDYSQFRYGLRVEDGRVAASVHPRWMAGTYADSTRPVVPELYTYRGYRVVRNKAAVRNLFKRILNLAVAHEVEVNLRLDTEEAKQIFGVTTTEPVFISIDRWGTMKKNPTRNLGTRIYTS